MSARAEASTTAMNGSYDARSGPHKSHDGRASAEATRTSLAGKKSYRGGRGRPQRMPKMEILTIDDGKKGPKDGDKGGHERPKLSDRKQDAEHISHNGAGATDRSNDMRQSGREDDDSKKFPPQKGGRGKKQHERGRGRGRGRGHGRGRGRGDGRERGEGRGDARFLSKDYTIVSAGDDFNRHLLSWYDKIYEKVQEASRQDTFEDLKQLMELTNGKRSNRYTLHPIGSAINNCLLPTSDIDATVLDKKSFGKKIPKPLSQAMRTQKDVWASMKVINGARVPIIKAIHRSDVEVDISFNNYLAVDNSRLLREYVFFPSICFPDKTEGSLLHLLTLAVKRWASLNEVNNTRNGGLSNYTFLNLVVFFLQHIGLLPCLQDENISGELYESSVEIGDAIYEYYFYTKVSPKPEEYELAKRYFERPGDLLKGFFEFYANFPWKDFAVSIRHGVPVSKRPQDRMKIFDPLDASRDLADVIRSADERMYLLQAFQDARKELGREDLSAEEKLELLLRASEDL